MSDNLEDACGDGGDGDADACELYQNVKGVITGLDTFFLIFAGALVFCMQAGFGMLCAGSVRAKNVKNIMLKNMLDACGGALGFWTLGYAFAYGKAPDSSEKTFIGTDGFLLIHGFDTGTALVSWFFQFAFAATAATIVAGTVAERCKMAAYLCYSVFLTAFVYPVIVHSIWSSDGWLTAFNDDPFRGVGVVDFAGSGVVHMTGGFTALIAAIILGPRRGRFYEADGKPLEKPAQWPGHSAALQMLGTFILWFGWYGFNPGSALIINNSDAAATAALCAVTTTIAAASGCATSLFTDTLIEWRIEGEASYDLTMAMNGALGGLVAITAGCSVVYPWASFVIGMIGGWVYLGASKLLIRLKIDDAVDAIPVHCFNGAWGVIAVGLFAAPDKMDIAGYNSAHAGWFYSWGRGSGDANLLLCQIVSILWIMGWIGTLMTPFFLLLNLLGMFRIDALKEDVGLDISDHRGPAYSLEMGRSASFKSSGTGASGKAQAEEPARKTIVAEEAEEDEEDFEA